MSAKKDLQELARYAERHGFTVVRRRNGHLTWRNAEGAFVSGSPSTPSDKRGLYNLQAKLHAAGLPRR